MGYCPRCGDNQPWGKTAASRAVRERRPIRVPVSSRIVTLPADVKDGERIRYGGILFEVRRTGDVIELHLVDR